MATMKWGLILTLLFSLCAFGQEKRFSSRFEIQRDLFAPMSSGQVFSPRTPDETIAGGKSTGLAAIYSLLVPGMGELYAGGFESGKYFLAAEGVLWLTYATFEVYGNQIRDDARAFAQAHAGVILTGKNDQYFVDIGNFINTDAFNQQALRDHDIDKLYNDPGYQWSWDSDPSRSTYRQQRIASDNMYNNRKFVVAAILINHVGSAINAVRAVISHNKELADVFSNVDVHADVMGGLSNPHGITLTLTKTF